MAARSCATSGFRAGVPTSGTARRPSPCICCGDCSVEKAPSKARLFVALDLPEGAREVLAAWRDDVFAGRDDVRLVAREALHVTLVFLGHLPEREIERIASLVRDAVPGGEAPLLAATGVKPVPPRRTRLFALDLTDADGRAGAVQAALSSALETAGLYEPE